MTTPDRQKVTKPLVYFQGGVVPWVEARVHAFSPVAKYGAGVFEGIRGYWNDEQHRMFVFRLDEHLQRLVYSQVAMRMQPLFDAPTVHAALLEMLEANAFTETVHVRAMVYVDGEGESYAAGPTGLVITARPRPMPAQFHAGVSVQVSSWRRIADQAMPMRVKANANYNNARLAGMQALTDGYDAAILLNDRGKVSEGPGMCVFIVRDGVPITPDVTSDILESITRDTVLTLLREDMDRSPVERVVDRSELYAAEEAFFCGTGWEITPIARIDGIAIGDGAPGPVTREIQRRYFDATHGRDTRRSHWLTPVASPR
jgi:branched-chain amino acid aminotransferase